MDETAKVRSPVDLDTPYPEITAVAISDAARSLYAGSPFFFRHTQRWRPFLCPFEVALPEVPEGARVLDVGCGAGLWLSMLARLRSLASGHGVDASAPAIRAARQMAEDGGLSRVLTFERSTDLAGVAVRSFAVVTMIDVLHHVPARGQRSFFLEAVERLQPGGRFIYKDMTERPRILAFCNTLQDMLLAQQIPHYVPEEEVLGWAGEAGLELKLSRVDRRFCFLHRLMVFERAGARP